MVTKRQDVLMSDLSVEAAAPGAAIYTVSVQLFTSEVDLNSPSAVSKFYHSLV